MKCTIVTVGDEILIGQIVDTNSAWISTELNLLGVEIKEILSVSDNEEAIKEAINRSLAQSDLVLMTGGLGPTKDDITKKSIADYFGVGMTFHQDTFDRITAIFKKFNREILPQHMAQCDMPDNATILANDLGTAPGMLFEKGNKKLISMPGVPFEMKFIFKTHIVPLVKKSVAESFSIVHKTLMTYGQGETWLADMMGDLAINIPQGLSIAYLPSLGFVRIRVTGKGDVTIGQKVEEYAKLIYEKIGKHVYGYDDETPQEAILRLAKAQNLTLSTAESCTGGRLGHMITTVSGSSYYYLGGVVTYSNDLKMKLLGVKSETLKEYGAVSEQTVIEMADGSIKLTGSDIAVSISGIAGPDGGTPEKPVGTIWIGLAQKGHPTEAIKIQASKDRQRNIEYATNVAMAKILKRLLSI